MSPEFGGDLRPCKGPEKRWKTKLLCAPMALMATHSPPFLMDMPDSPPSSFSGLASTNWNYRFERFGYSFLSIKIQFCSRFKMTGMSSTKSVVRLYRVVCYWVVKISKPLERHFRRLLRESMQNCWTGKHINILALDIYRTKRNHFGICIKCVLLIVANMIGYSILLRGRLRWCFIL